MGVGFLSIRLAPSDKSQAHVLDKERHGTIGDSAQARITMARDFDSCQFYHESRNNNFEAHSLAKYALSLGVGRHIWAARYPL